MIYEVNESRFFSILNIKEITNYDAEILKVTEEGNIAYYNLEVVIKYQNLDEEEKEELIQLPIEFNVRESEEIDVILKNIIINVIENNGVELNFDISVDVSEMEENIDIQEKEDIEIPVVELDVIEKAEEIKEAININNEDKIELKVLETSNNKPFDICKNLRNSSQKYKMIMLCDEQNFDKISLKYNIKMEELYRLKKEGLKVIVCAKE